MTFKQIGLIFPLLLTLTACQSQNTPMTHSTNQIEQKMIEQPLLPDNTTNLDEQLSQYDWQLIDAIDKNKQPISQLNKYATDTQLKFSQTEKGNNIRFTNGCNTMSTSYQRQGNQLITSMIMSTKMYCKNKDIAEKQLSQLMAMQSTINLQARQTQPKLTLVTADGSMLTWQGQQVKSQHSEAKTLFLDIAPDTQVCPTGSQQTGVEQTHCLKVREVFYYKNWTVSGYGDWYLMTQPIQGYQHDAKYRKRLRIKKHITDPTTIKGKQEVYLLDAVVVTEIVK